MKQDDSNWHEKAQETLEEYSGADLCECGEEYMSGPTDGCPSYEHESVWQTVRAVHWYETAQRLNPTHHLRREVLEEPSGVPHEE